ncbi:zinc metalloproteinase nas-14-like [Neocloeon triangulifer]|uniref:zinc metalloproteinase nas-14-like n=1 Tax=Neocloeon triangulifer TaxID=2078957 RepID=UPI00286F0E8A|nr:zinc metalloproteinase nas-14-like [Neocloeon triangulifer]
MAAVLLALLTLAGGAVLTLARPSADLNDPAEDFPALPPVLHPGYFSPDYKANLIAGIVSTWNPNDATNVWELSGLKEGDIMEDAPRSRNVVSDPETLWKDATIPYILEPMFNDAERKTIREGMDMIEQGSCFKFRPFQIGDLDFVYVQGGPTGCWSYVGRQGGGQVVNLQRSGCVHKGVVAHELLHASGFFHQQSAADRDDFIFINFTNIQPGRESNFDKYNESIVSDFGVGYDYNSVMHYSRKAFSKNGEDTLVPLQDGAEIGNRHFVTDKDMAKLKAKYGCGEQGGQGATEAPNSYGNMMLKAGNQLLALLVPPA